MKLERHVGGLSLARKVSYLSRRGWTEADGDWVCVERALGPSSLKRAVHQQLTDDLCRALAPAGWIVVGYSPTGYAQLREADGTKTCSLPAALRKQARREGRRVADLTYSLFLAVMLDAP